MLLIIRNSYDPTVDYVVEYLNKHSIHFFRLNTDLFLTNTQYHFKVSNNTLEIEITQDNQRVNTKDITAVWYRRPQEPKVIEGLSTQAKVFSVTEAQYVLKELYNLLGDRVWVSKPEKISRANSKLNQLCVANKLGLKTPTSLCTNDPKKARDFILKHKQVIVKPFKANVVEFDGQAHFIYTNEVTEEHLAGIENVRLAPTFFQEKIEKSYEIRVTVFGDKVFATRIDSQSDPKLQTDWRQSTDNLTMWTTTTLPDTVSELCLAMTRHYDLQFGAFDFAVTPKGEYIFFEMNPNGQWAWQEIQIGIPMTEALIKTLKIKPS
jgi:glutathione synthase/RimK-type ligase-like ATP-grasp enzyme